AFHLEHQARRFPFVVVCAIREELIYVRIHARRRLAGADGADDEDPGVQAAFRYDEPRWLYGTRGRGALMLLAEDQKKILTRVRLGVRWQAGGSGPSCPTAEKDGHAREADAGEEEGRGEPQTGVRVGEASEQGGTHDVDQREHGVVRRKGVLMQPERAA